MVTGADEARPGESAAHAEGTTCSHARVGWSAREGAEPEGSSCAQGQRRPPSTCQPAVYAPHQPGVPRGGQGGPGPSELRRPEFRPHS